MNHNNATMKINLLMLLCVIGVTSCYSQNRNDLLSMHFDQPITVLIGEHKLEQFQDPNYGIYTYKTDQLDGFKIADIDLSTYKYPNGRVADFNRIQIYVDSRTSKKYLGFRYTTVRQDEIQELIASLKKNYPEFEQRKDSAGDVYLWDLKSLNAWLFYYPNHSVDGNGKDFLNSNFLYVKKGTRLDDSKDSSIPTIWQQIDGLYPKD